MSKKNKPAGKHPGNKPAITGETNPATDGLTITNAVKYSGVSYAKIRRMAKLKIINPAKIGRAVIISPDDYKKIIATKGMFIGRSGQGRKRFDFSVDAFLEKIRDNPDVMRELIKINDSRSKR